MGKVHLKVMPSLAETLGTEETSEEIISDPQNEDDRPSVRDLLNRLAARYPRFGPMVFDVSAQKLTGRIIIFFNGRDLELVDGLETRLIDGDTVTFIPIIEGG